MSIKHNIQQTASLTHADIDVLLASHFKRYQSSLSALDLIKQRLSAEIYRLISTTAAAWIMGKLILVS